MFGPRLKTVFASRWKAVWWAATILIGAYFSIPSAEETAAEHPAPPAHQEPANPWALDKR